MVFFIGFSWALKRNSPSYSLWAYWFFIISFYLSFHVRTDWAQDPYFSSSIIKDSRCRMAKFYPCNNLPFTNQKKKDSRLDQKKNLKTAGAQTCRKRTAPARVQGNLLGRVRSSWFDVCDGANLCVILRTAKLLHARLGTENPRQGLTAFAAMEHPTYGGSLIACCSFLIFFYLLEQVIIFFHQLKKKPRCYMFKLLIIWYDMIFYCAG